MFPRNFEDSMLMHDVWVKNTFMLFKTMVLFWCFRNLVYNGKYNMQAWGLIVLLISKAAGCASTISEMEQDKSAGILHSQRALAEVTEMIRTAHLVHQGLMNLQPLAKAGNELSSESEMILGNKIALLSGDYLLGNASSQIATLRFGEKKIA